MVKGLQAAAQGALRCRALLRPRAMPRASRLPLRACRGMGRIVCTSSYTHVGWEVGGWVGGCALWGGLVGIHIQSLQGIKMADFRLDSHFIAVYAFYDHERPWVARFARCLFGPLGSGYLYLCHCILINFALGRDKGAVEHAPTSRTRACLHKCGLNYGPDSLDEVS